MPTSRAHDWQFFVRSAGTGVLARGALIASLYRHAVKLSGKSRTTITNSQLVNHISTDISRIDFSLGFAHSAYIFSPLAALFSSGHSGMDRAATADHCDRHPDCQPRVR
jgi:hypothetical protein